MKTTILIYFVYVNFFVDKYSFVVQSKFENKYNFADNPTSIVK